MVLITLKQTAMSFGTNLTRKAERDPPFVLLTVPQLKVARSRSVGSEHRSCVILISILGVVLDYHLKENFKMILQPVIENEIEINPHSFMLVN